MCKVRRFFLMSQAFGYLFLFYTQKT
ncbi:hypothetical protein C7379_11079 [Hallella colorans]|uniref:Uncharacterized protein n=1 Tax=Hallella colorans TaxID=1703337 RepID=A0A2U0U7R0_9BACT|nr:hypothetical protein C7379_11079 [Hallella colorans]